MKEGGPMRIRTAQFQGVGVLFALMLVPMTALGADARDSGTVLAA